MILYGGTYMPGTVVGTLHPLTHLVVSTVLPGGYSSSLPCSAQGMVTQQVSGGVALLILGCLAPDVRVSLTGVALGLLFLCVELTHFWQIARELQKLMILGYSPD